MSNSVHYRWFVRLQVRKDFWVNHIELGLNLVASDVVHSAGLLVEYQMLCGGGEPLHPLCVFVCSQDGFRSHVDHHCSRVLTPPGLVTA